MKTVKKDLVRVMIGSGEHSMFIKVPKGKRVMIGSGEHSMFIRAGVTPKSIDERYDDMLKRWKKEERKENVKTRIRSLFR